MPDFPWFLSLPLFCSIVYVAAVMKLKYIARYEITIWQTSFYMNCVTASLCLPFLFVGNHADVVWGNAWQLPLAAFLCWAGQITTLIALERGDVSIATPVMGLKILFVVFGQALFDHKDVSKSLWIAAFLSFLAILLLQARSKVRHHHIFFTVALSGTSAFCFAMFDLLTTEYSKDWGNLYLPIVIGLVFFMSFFIWLCKRKRVELPRNAKLALWFGIVMFGIQIMLFTFSVAHFHEPARNNIVYNLRGLWSVLAVWLIGHWYDNSEQHLERSVLIRRLIGAGLMLAAVFLAFNP